MFAVYIRRFRINMPSHISQDHELAIPSTDFLALVPQLVSDSFPVQRRTTRLSLPLHNKQSMPFTPFPPFLPFPSYTARTNWLDCAFYALLLAGERKRFGRP